MSNNNDDLPMLDQELAPEPQLTTVVPVLAAEEQPEPPAEELSAPSDDGLQNLDTDDAADVKAETENGESVDETNPPFHFPAPAPTNNATQERRVFAPLDKPWDDGNITLSLPPDTMARTRNYLESQPNTDLTDTQEGADWLALSENGMEHGSFQDFTLPAAKRDGANYRQRIRHGDKLLEAASPRLGDDGPMLKGERGVLRVQALIGRGSILQIPLWHSGFWITLKCPKETKLMELHQRMAEEKIRFGRITHGLAFANYMAFTVDALLSFALEHIYETSVKDLTSAAELRSMIKTPDLHLIAWGLACTIWPRGFQYERSLLDENGQTTRTVREKLNVGSLLWVDDNSLDDFQRAHMNSRATGSMTKDAIRNYGEHFVRGKPKAYALSDEILMTLRVPTVDQYVNSGQAWVNETVAAVTAAFTEETSLQRRNELVQSRGKATTMRQFSHWIAEFEFPNINKRMTDEDTITEQAAWFSADDEIRAKYYDAVRDYINDSTVAIIATPLVDNDEKEMTKGQTVEKFPWLLPLDPISTFFTLLSQKVMQIQVRQ